MDFRIIYNPFQVLSIQQWEIESVRSLYDYGKVQHSVGVWESSAQVKSWYHSAGLFAKACHEKGYFSQNIVINEMAYEGRWQRQLVNWQRSGVSFLPGYALPIQSVLASIKRSLPCSCRLAGDAVDDWIKRVFDWQEVFEQLGVDDDDLSNALAKVIGDSLRPDCMDIRLEVEIGSSFPGEVQQACGLIYEELSLLLKKSPGEIRQALRVDESQAEKGGILFAPETEVLFPQGMTIGSRRLTLEVVVKRVKTASQFSGNFTLSLDDLLAGDELLRLPVKDIWYFVFSDYVGGGAPSCKEECLELAMSYVLRGGGCLNPERDQKWMQRLIEWAMDASLDQPVRQISFWVKEFRLQHYQKQPFVEVAMRYQLSELLRPFFSEEEISYLWDLKVSVDKCPKGLVRVITEALAKDRLPFSLVNAWIQLIGVVTIGLSEQEGVKGLQLDFSAKKDALRVDCGGYGEILIGLDLSQSLRIVSEGMVKYGEAANRLLTGLLKAIGPQLRTSDREMVVYLQKLGLDAWELKALAGRFLCDNHPVRCGLGYLLHELFYRLQPDVIRSTELLVRLPTALSSFHGAERSFFLQGLDKVWEGSSCAFLHEGLEELSHVSKGVTLLWLQQLVRGPSLETRAAAITLWKNSSIQRGGWRRSCYGRGWILFRFK